MLKLNKVLFLFIAIFFISGLLLSPLYPAILHYKNTILFYILFQIILSLGTYYIFERLTKFKYSKLYIGISIFLVALFIRLMFANIFNYIPTNDFINYYNLGMDFLNGNKGNIKSVISGYNIPYFGGLSVLYGLIYLFFGASYSGSQIAFSVISSLTCLIIYLIVSEINIKAAIISSIIFIFYPASMITAQINNNQQPATLFYLISIYFIIKFIIKFKLKNIVLSSIFMVIGNFFHPSAISHVISTILFITILFILTKDKIKKNLLFKGLSCFILIFLILNNGIFIILKKTDILEDRNYEFSFLTKAVVGLNKEHEGKYFPEGYGQFAGLTKKEIYDKSFTILKNEFKHPSEFFSLIVRKTGYMWFSADNIIFLLSDGMSNKIIINNQNITDFLYYIDLIYVYFMYFILALGSLWNIFIKKDEYLILENDVYFITNFMLIMWMFVHFISEVQSRYKYFGMPIISVLSGIYILGIIKHINRKFS